MSHKSGPLISACGAHVIQDGLVALQYVLLPVIAQTFGLNYAQVGIVRSVSNGAISALEIPSGILAESFGERKLLAMGLVCAGVGYIGVAHSESYTGLLICFLIAGAGAGFQHSLSSAILVRAYGSDGRRQALGIYNAFGDAGKLAYTGLFSLAIGAGLGWNAIVMMLSIAAVIFGFLCLRLVPRASESPNQKRLPQEHNTVHQVSKWGINEPVQFSILGIIVFLDSTIQAVFLTFLAFVFIGNGVSEALAGIAVVIALAGGMAGKIAGGYLASSLGDRVAFIVFQLLKIVGLIALVYLPAMAALFCLPLIGLVVQGSSTITYGSVADYVAEEKQSRGYSLIYTVANGASVTGPFLFGLLADQYGLELTYQLAAVIALITIFAGSICLVERKS